jgi:hypothetical protein
MNGFTRILALKDIKNIYGEDKNPFQFLKYNERILIENILKQKKPVTMHYLS